MQPLATQHPSTLTPMAYNLDAAQGFRMEDPAVNQEGGIIDAVNVSEEELRELLKTT